MIIGVLRERKLGEHRVGLTPAGVSVLTRAGHTVFVETGAGVGSGFSDILYRGSGGFMCSRPKEIALRADIVVKIKELLSQEYYLLKTLRGKILFTYFHLTGSPVKLTKLLLKHSVTALAYETIENAKGQLPLLAPMSTVAGVAAIQYAAEYLQKKHGGCGITLGKIEGTEPARVVIVGGGIAGTSAAHMALGMGAHVTVLENRKERVAELKKIFQGKDMRILEAVKDEVDKSLKGAHVLIGATLRSGARAEHVVSEEQVSLTVRGAVIVDIAIDQGGCIFGSRPTTHEEPTYIHEGRVYCCVTNMPGQVPLHSTPALTKKTLPYILAVANDGLTGALLKDPGLTKGLNIFSGHITCETIAQDLHMKKFFKDPYDLLIVEPIRNMPTS